MPKLNLQDLLSDKASIKYPCTKQVIAMSVENPARLYPDFDFFVPLLDNSNNFIKWTAIRVVGNLASVDVDNKIDTVIPKLLKFLNVGKMITAGNSIQALAEIAKHKPRYKDKIFREIIKVEKYDYDTDECRNVAIGHALKALEMFKDELKEKKALVGFIKRQTENSRNAVKKRAEKLLKRITA